MKGIRFIIITLIFAMAELTTIAQGDAILDGLSISERDGKVYLRWVIASGNTCDGVSVFRSADTIQFEKIGKIDGVCGSPFSAVAYDFIDESPILNQINYYHLELGNVGFSRIIGIFVADLSNAAYKLFPNPASQHLQLLFSNPKQLSHLLTIYSIDGLLVKEYTTNTSSFQTDVSTFKNGLYIFVIQSNENKQITDGKFIILN